MKAKLIDLCRQENHPFGYYVETLGGNNYEPRLLYRVYVNDGHQELVRGAEFDELDTRALRNDSSQWATTRSWKIAKPRSRRR